MPLGTDPHVMMMCLLVHRMAPFLVASAWCSGYFRLALAQKNLGRLDAASETIKKGLSVDLCESCCHSRRGTRLTSPTQPLTLTSCVGMLVAQPMRT